mmetsp:Transcript_30599/g.72180  ORF Transcript_30599/g.72180 Transcript_30599/m.72180 type:complete len:267 (-) Transcript_30599:318-1118(-)|eukprot:CAMPEP_0172394054 /NCGR_PEP_ID=MMETSP1061-20121228/13314_1 /TAXON_ID=37318 /ORGANISM="Pseudo-nitzschia pungens, Strain cf. pungens" /LENGTH=266 /DNA_ID=CAMNT_0013125323 /DNA_START=128 /DNA_END=928 /DNA_ORIENTATION=+
MTEKDINWRETLYVWDGIVTAGMPTLTGEDSTQKSESIPLQWEGLWVPVLGVPDATKAEAPKRNAFKRDIDADCNFSVGGTATPRFSKDGDAKEKDKEKDKDEDHFFFVKLTEGTGWEMKDDDNGDADKSKKATHQDQVHDVLIKTIRWSGNQQDERESLVVAKGHNNFGPFCSVGWMRPGCRWTVARRYLSEEDPRAKWSLDQWYDAIVKESIVEVEHCTETMTTERQLKLPPWQVSLMHVDYKDGEEQESSEDGGGKRQKLSSD